MSSFDKNFVPSFNQKNKFESMKIITTSSKIKPSVDLNTSQLVNKELVNVQSQRSIN
jgi:hypothetical protein